ncbi:MAG: hypothetical protein RL684_3309 [Pseudomonadota bacterium]
MKAFIELLRAFEPLIITLMPVITMFAAWWIKNHSDRTADKQTQELKAHSDENRVLTMKQLPDKIAEATGTHRQLEG